VSCDDLVEEVETFNMTLTLVSSNPLVRVGRDTAEGRISDSTGIIVTYYPCWYFYYVDVVIMGQSSYDIRENSCEVTLTLTLSQVSFNTFEVILTTMNITATGG